MTNPDPKDELGERILAIFNKQLDMTDNEKMFAVKDLVLERERVAREQRDREWILTAEVVNKAQLQGGDNAQEN